MFQKSRSKLLALTTAMTFGAIAPAAFAGGGGIDVSSVTTAISGAAAPIAAIGAAVLVVLVGVKVYKWIRRAL